MEEKNFWKNMIQKLADVFSKLNMIFNGDIKFEEDIMIPAEEEVTSFSQENETTNADLLGGIKQFIDENITSRVTNLKEQTRDIMPDLSTKNLNNEERGELSQNDLDSKINTDVDQMDRIAKEQEEQEDEHTMHIR